MKIEMLVPTSDIELVTATVLNYFNFRCNFVHLQLRTVRNAEETATSFVFQFSILCSSKEHRFTHASLRYVNYKIYQLRVEKFTNYEEI